MSFAFPVETPAAQPASQPPAAAMSHGKLGQKLLGWVLIALIFSGVGYVVWKQFGGPRQQDLTEVQPSVGQRIVAGAGLNLRRPAELVRPKPNGLIANAGDVHLDAVKPPKLGQWNFIASYNRGDLTTPDQTAALTARFRLVADAAYAKSLKLTDDQAKQLAAIPSGVTLPLSDDDKAKLAALCQTYVDAKDKAPAQAALLKHLESLGPIKLADTKRNAAARVAQIEAILTPQQLAPFKK